MDGWDASENLPFPADGWGDAALELELDFADGPTTPADAATADVAAANSAQLDAEALVVDAATAVLDGYVALRASVARFAASAAVTGLPASFVGAAAAASTVVGRRLWGPPSAAKASAPRTARDAVADDSEDASAPALSLKSTPLLADAPLAPTIFLASVSPSSGLSPTLAWGIGLGDADDVDEWDRMLSAAEAATVPASAPPVVAAVELALAEQEESCQRVRENAGDESGAEASECAEAIAGTVACAPVAATLARAQALFEADANSAAVVRAKASAGATAAAEVAAQAEAQTEAERTALEARAPAEVNAVAQAQVLMQESAPASVEADALAAEAVATAGRLRMARDAAANLALEERLRLRPAQAAARRRLAELVLDEGRRLAAEMKRETDPGAEAGEQVYKAEETRSTPQLLMPALPPPRFEAGTDGDAGATASAETRDFPVDTLALTHVDYVAAAAESAAAAATTAAADALQAEDPAAEADAKAESSARAQAGTAAADTEFLRIAAAARALDLFPAVRLALNGALARARVTVAQAAQAEAALAAEAAAWARTEAETSAAVAAAESAAAAMAATAAVTARAQAAAASVVRAVSTLDHFAQKRRLLRAQCLALANATRAADAAAMATTSSAFMTIAAEVETSVLPLSLPPPPSPPLSLSLPPEPVLVLAAHLLPALLGPLMTSLDAHISALALALTPYRRLRPHSSPSISLGEGGAYSPPFPPSLPPSRLLVPREEPSGDMGECEDESEDEVEDLEVAGTEVCSEAALPPRPPLPLGLAPQQLFAWAERAFLPPLGEAHCALARLDPTPAPGLLQELRRLLALRLCRRLVLALGPALRQQGRSALRDPDWAFAACNESNGEGIDGTGDGEEQRQAIQQDDMEDSSDTAEEARTASLPAFQHAKSRGPAVTSAPHGGRAAVLRALSPAARFVLALVSAAADADAAVDACLSLPLPLPLPGGPAYNVTAPLPSLAPSSPFCGILACLVRTHLPLVAATQRAAAWAAWQRGHCLRELVRAANAAAEAQAHAHSASPLQLLRQTGRTALLPLSLHLEAQLHTFARLPPALLAQAFAVPNLGVVALGAATAAAEAARVAALRLEAAVAQPSALTAGPGSSLGLGLAELPGGAAAQARAPFPLRAAEAEAAAATRLLQPGLMRLLRKLLPLLDPGLRELGESLESEEQGRSSSHARDGVSARARAGQRNDIDEWRHVLQEAGRRRAHVAAAALASSPSLPLPQSDAHDWAAAWASLRIHVGPLDGRGLAAAVRCPGALLACMASLRAAGLVAGAAARFGETLLLRAGLACAPARGEDWSRGTPSTSASADDEVDDKEGDEGGGQQLQGPRCNHRVRAALFPVHARLARLAALQGCLARAQARVLAAVFASMSQPWLQTEQTSPRSDAALAEALWQLGALFVRLRWGRDPGGETNSLSVTSFLAQSAEGEALASDADVAALVVRAVGTAFSSDVERAVDCALSVRTKR